MTTVVEEFEGTIVPLFAFLLGLVAAYVSLVVFAFVGSGNLFLGADVPADLTVGSIRSLALFSLVFLFVPLIAPFLAAGVWGTVHGVTVGVTGPGGFVPIGTVPLLGVVDGGLELLAPVLLVVVGVTLAFANEQSLPLRPVVATAVGVVGYVAAAALFMFLSALLYNAAVGALVGQFLGSAGGLGTITYPDPVAALVTVGVDATPFVAGGAVLGTGWLALTAGTEEGSASAGTGDGAAGAAGDDDGATDSDGPVTAVEEARGTGSGPRPGDELPDFGSSEPEDTDAGRE